MVVKGIVLLTGGSGMVGRNILEHPSVHEWKIFAPESLTLDLTDYNATVTYVDALKPDIIIHAAGKVGGIQANIAQPVDFLVKNMDMGRNILMAARETGVKKLLNLGSSCMYPRNASNPLKENLILQGELEPTNEGYALAKIMTERLCRYINSEDSEYSYKTLIPCNLYGRHDKFEPEQSHLIPAIIHKIHHAIEAGHSNVEIWGDGNARREFMYASDFAKVVMRSLDYFDSLPMVMNVGLGNDYSINDYYRTTADVIGYKGSFTHDLSKPAGMKQKLVSIEKQQAWGWKSNVSLTEGITETYKYYKSKYIL